MGLYVWIALFGFTSYMIAWFIDNKYPFGAIDTFASFVLCVIWVLAARETKRIMVRN